MGPSIPEPVADPQQSHEVWAWITESGETFIEKLRSSMPDVVYVYSQNSALSFLKLINNYKLNDFWMNTNLMCISEKSSSVLNKIKWKKIFLFNSGEEEFLLYKI